MNRPLLKQALDALEIGAWYVNTEFGDRVELDQCNAAIEALKAELAKPEPEPVAWVHVSDTKMPWDKTLPYKFAFVKEESWTFAVPLYAVPLRSPTDAELVELARDSKNCEGNSMLPVAFAREVEALVTGTRNCSRHPDAPHGPDGAGCKCHNWALGEAS